jgi:heme-degrading monooxygenase HmoA
MTKQTCVKSAIATPGNLGVTVLHRTEGDVTHHTFISYWKDLDAVKRFAGEDYKKPRVFLEENGLLLEPEGVVEHRTV